MFKYINKDNVIHKIFNPSSLWESNVDFSKKYKLSFPTDSALTSSLLVVKDYDPIENRCVLEWDSASYNKINDNDDIKNISSKLIELEEETQHYKNIINNNSEDLLKKIDNLILKNIKLENQLKDIKTNQLKSLVDLKYEIFLPLLTPENNNSILVSNKILKKGDMYEIHLIWCA